MPTISQDFSALSSTTCLFPEANNADTNADAQTQGSGVFIAPSANVPARPADITGFFVVSATEEGKLEFHSGDGLLSLTELSDVTITNPVQSQYLCYNGNMWVNAYVDSTSPWKAPVRAATTANIVLSAPQTVDGVVLVAGDRVLVKDQAAPVENGIYDVAAGAWTRSSDFAAGESAGCDIVCVQEGVVSMGLLYKCTTTPPSDVVGTDALAFGLAVDGIISVNGDSTPAQVIAVTNPITLLDAGATHTIGVLDAGVGQSGVVTAGIQQFDGQKTFNDLVTANLAVTVAGGDLTVSVGNVVVTSGSITATVGNITSGATVQGVAIFDGVATLTGGALSAVTSIGCASVTATGAVQGLSLTDGVATMTLGALSAVTSIGCASVTATGAVQGLSFTDGTFNATGGIFTGVTSVSATTLSCVGFNSTTGASNIGTGGTVGFFGAGPVGQQPVAAPNTAFVANTSGIVDGTATYKGYTVEGLVDALQALGLIA